MLAHEASTAVASTSYNLARNRHLKRIRWSIILAKTVVIAGCAAWGIYGALDYLANTPRERAVAKYTFWQRVGYGLGFYKTAILSTLTAPEDDPRSTQLPVLEIYLREKKLDGLKSHLPKSGKVFQSGLFRVRLRHQKDLVFKAKVRLRGDSINHWAFPQKSWRVKLKKGTEFDGLRTFNLYLPRSKSQLPDFLGYWMAEQMGGLVVPKAYPVHFRLNRKFDGVRVFLEQVNEEFPKNHQLNAEKIFIGDVDATEIYSAKARDKLFESARGWEVVTTAKNSGAQEDNRTELEELTKLVTLGMKDSARFSSEIRKILDVEMVLRYMAFLEMVNSVHVDATHNQKYFVDKGAGLLRPIVWDPVAYHWDDSGKLDLSSNRLFITLLLVPEFRNLKNRYLWEAINSDLSSGRIVEKIRSEAARVRADIMAMPIKVYTPRNSLAAYSNEEWEEAVEQLIQSVSRRHETIKRLLSSQVISAEVVRKPEGLTLNIQVSGDPGFALEKLKMKSSGSGSLPGSVSLRGPDSELSHSAVVEKSGEFGVVKLSGTLFASRVLNQSKKVEAEKSTFEFEIRDQRGGISIVEVIGHNSVTGQSIVVPVALGAGLK